MPDVAVPSQLEEKYTPTVYVDLTKADVGELKGIQVGDKVKVVIEGTVQSFGMRKDAKDKTGNLSVQTKDVTIRKVSKNDFEKLAEDDE